MAQSLSSIPVHLIFSTKNRALLIHEEIREDLHSYIVGGMKAYGCFVLEINSVEDHIHILFDLSRTISVSDVVKEIKAPSSVWMKIQGARYSEFMWQAGYGAFGVSPSKVGAVQRYILNQGEHHKQVSFQTEYREFLAKHNVPFDERYVWD